MNIDADLRGDEGETNQRKGGIQAGRTVSNNQVAYTMSE